MNNLSVSEQLIIFSRYIGQQLLIYSNLNNQISIGTLSGVKSDAVAVTVDGVNRWIPLHNNFKLCEIRLLLKPLRKLTEDIKTTANSLPGPAFITPYYQQQGYDMPVFISAGHPCNGRYLHELNLADYRTTAEIYQQNTLLNAFNSA
ncbi:hypothetical protein [Mucilaginibacter celer]|uniref:Uncharacterized protein n=1 Tax=Mucilaginibacter celer TaxID=2305508 RepID=A0A494VRX5_9SPHI|nr:hypothetical protein [Mucilaginibacter celer]AYL94118.1 hypothetical protein HYN43_001870 [Mucilaginibacter celer]